MYTCAKCKKEFPTLAAGLAHAQLRHGLTRQGAQNEIKQHTKRR